MAYLTMNTLGGLGSRIAGTLCAAALLVACGDDNPAMSGGQQMPGPDGGGTDTSQTPPTTRSALTEWLASGVYKQWSCEPAVHEARAPSPHGFNRICSNDKISANAAGTDAWPSGAAAVKELYRALTDTAPSGYSVYLKTKADSAGGANWYWYETLPPAGGDPVVFEGMGDMSPVKDVCVACHKAAGSDAMHTPSLGGRDQVYTPVP